MDATRNAVRPPSFGTAPDRLHRRDAPATSVAAAERVPSSPLERLVWASVKNFKDGAIQDDILAMHPDKAYSSITARFSSLLAKGFLIDTGVRRKGLHGRYQRIMIAAYPSRKG